jgi:hypothetical protein
MVKDQQEDCSDCNGAGDGPWGFVVEECECRAEKDDGDGEWRKMSQREAGDGVCAWVLMVVFMLPGVDVEAVEAAESAEEKCGGKECEAEVGAARDCGDKGSGGEADAYGDLFGKAMGDFLLRRGAASGVDEDEISEDYGSEDEIEADGGGFETWEEQGESDGGCEDSSEEGGAVAVVEVVARFEVCEEVRLCFEDACVHQAVGCVEGPDGEGHGERGDTGEVDVHRGCNEACPQNSYSGGVER